MFIFATETLDSLTNKLSFFLFSKATKDSEKLGLYSFLKLKSLRNWFIFSDELVQIIFSEDQVYIAVDLLTALTSIFSIFSRFE